VNYDSKTIVVHSYCITLLHTIDGANVRIIQLIRTLPDLLCVNPEFCYLLVVTLGCGQKVYI